MKRSFRVCAIISGLIERRHPGQEKTGRQMTVSSDLIYDVLRQHEPGHILLKAAFADAATGLIDVGRLGYFLRRIKGRIRHIALRQVSPLAVPVMLEIGRESVPGEASEVLLRETVEELIAEALSGHAARQCLISCRKARRPLRAHIGVSGHKMRPLAAGALYWEAEDTLLVADLHLEKGAAFAALGMLLPPYDTRTTLERLAQGDPRRRSLAGGGARRQLSPQRLRRTVWPPKTSSFSSSCNRAANGIGSAAITIRICPPRSAARCAPRSPFAASRSGTSPPPLSRPGRSRATSILSRALRAAAR